jgi:hypothetical protein
MRIGLTRINALIGRSREAATTIIHNVAAADHATEALRPELDHVHHISRHHRFVHHS